MPISREITGMKTSVHNMCCCFAAMVGIVFGFCVTTWVRSTLVPCLMNFHYTEDFDPGSFLFLHHSSKHDDPTDVSPNFRVLFGIMTAEKYLDDRADAVMNSWRKNIPDGSDIYFFVGANSSATKKGLPAVRLKDVDDTYPPQRKSFYMLKHFYEHGIGKYDWFVRIDDDGFINLENLYRFLSSLDPTRPLYLGQAGFGKKHEKGKMGLRENENYCMGGTGMVFSAKTIELLAPHIEYCLANLVTDHEDVEVGRCIARYVGVTCNWALEAQHFFYNSYISPVEKAYAGDVNFLDARRAFILHPVKLGIYQYRLAWINALNKAKQIRHRLSNIQRKIRNLEEPESHRVKHPLNTYGSKADRNTVKSWDFFDKAVSSISNENPRFYMDSALRLAVREMNIQLLELLNQNASGRGRIIEYRDVYYAFRRVHPLLGVDHVLDILLRYRRVVGDRPLSMAVRRHSYFRQSYAVPEVRERSTLLLDNGSRQTRVNFILPLAGRFKTFVRFAKMLVFIVTVNYLLITYVFLQHRFESAFLENKENVSLTIILFSIDDEEDESINDFVENLKTSYRDSAIHLHTRPKGEPFSRGVGLQIGAKLFGPNDLLFFIDVDISVTRDLLSRVRTLVQMNESVYLPIVFSEYNPAFSCHQPNCPAISDGSGYWRQYGFGIAAMYGSELDQAGGFDTSIQGWGKEDVDLCEKLVKSGVTIMRSPEPSLIHKFHPVHCSNDIERDAVKRAMCEGTRLSGYGDRRTLARLLLQLGIVQHEGGSNVDDGDRIEPVAQ